jgi:hypothetical protein
MRGQKPGTGTEEKVEGEHGNRGKNHIDIQGEGAQETKEQVQRPWDSSVPG